MLRKIRIILSVVCFALITLLFLDFTGTLHMWLCWLAKIQFLPAVLAMNVGVLILLVVLTWIFGRVYCSVIRLLGVLTQPRFFISLYLSFRILSRFQDKVSTLTPLFDK